MILGLTAFALFSSTFLGWLIARLIVRPLAQVGERMERLRSVCVTGLQGAIEALAEGDLTVLIEPTTTPVEVSQRDEIGQMAATFNAMLEQTKKTLLSYEEARHALTVLIGQVAQSAEAVAGHQYAAYRFRRPDWQSSEDIAYSMQEVAKAADQSATTSRDMAKGSEQQAFAASEAAGEMERLNTAIQQVQAGTQQQQHAAQQANEGMQQAAKSVEEVARSSQQMAETARQATMVAQTGGKAVEQTVASMGRIKEQVQVSSAPVTELGQMGQAIGAIVETIDQIAEQTNLLALNAAIEACKSRRTRQGLCGRRGRSAETG